MSSRERDSLSDASSNPLEQQEAVKVFLRQNAEQMEIRRRELDLQHQTDANNFEYAKLALSAQATDLQHHRGHEEKQTYRRYWFVGMTLVIVVVFLSYSLYLGKEEFAEGLAKILLGFLTGGTSGYFYGKSKGEGKAIPQQNPPQ